MTELESEKFFYFAYGSNLLEKRIHIQNPTAVRRGIAKLKDYRFDFCGCSRRWGGCGATIVPDPGKHVWGAVWELATTELDNLDMQEGVKSKIYKPLQVEVVTPEGETMECRSYKTVEDPPTIYEVPGDLPNNRMPSRVYLEVVLKGAVESNLPKEYLRFLKSFPHNGYAGPVAVPGFESIKFDLTDDSTQLN